MTTVFPSRVCIVFWVILCGSLFTATAVVAQPRVVFKAYIGQLPPFNYQDANGMPKGILIDALETISLRAENPIIREDIAFIPFPRAVNEVQHVPGAVVFAMARTHERENLYSWVGPVDSIQSGLVAKKSRKIRFKSTEDIRNYSIGTIHNSAPEARLEQMFRGDMKNVIALPTNRQQFEMLAKDRVDLITQSDAAAPLLLEELHLSPADYEMVYVLRRVELHYAFSKQTDPALIARFNQELQKLKSPGPNGTSEYDAIVERYVTGGPIAVVTGE